VAAASSARNTVILGEGRPVAIIGGRLNAAVNEAVRLGLVSGDPGPARQTARAQEKEGAQILLLKVGAAGVDETQAIRQILEQLAPTSRHSFLLDAGRVETVEQALRFYPGRLLVHVAGDEAAALLPVLAKYGAVPVLRIAKMDGLPMDRAGVRKAVADARAHGFAKVETVIDCTAPAQNPEALRAALGMIAWCAQNLGCPTLLDITGVGKGLPELPWLQASLLAAAQAAGLTIAVIDPAVAEPMKIRTAGDRLWGE
jgi:cobalamin-dependent methionine synthase I